MVNIHENQWFERENIHNRPHESLNGLMDPWLLLLGLWFFKVGRYRREILKNQAS